MADREQVSTSTLDSDRRRASASQGRQRPALVILINALHSGGAEKTCVELARQLRESYEVQVVGLLTGGPIERELRSLGVGVTVPRSSSGVWVKLQLVWELIRLLRRRRPTMVITFLYLADFIGGSLARVLVPRAAVFWNIRCNVLGADQLGAVSRLFVRINAFASAVVPSGIVYCSRLSRQQHEGIGFRGRRSFVVENSPAAVAFAFDGEKRAAFRLATAVNRFAFLFVGRFDPVKRVDVFIEACARVQRARTGEAQFLLAGSGMDAGNPQLRAVLEASGAAEGFVLLGYVSDQQALYSAADCLVVTSESEGSPNVVYEAMAARLPTLILATVGTEAISGYGVQRLPTRGVKELAEAMHGHLAVGVAADATRMAIGARAAPTEHPLVSFYKNVLAAGC
jgi:glycosyltransferase involved in cell wall biosynthesis